MTYEMFQLFSEELYRLPVTQDYGHYYYQYDDICRILSNYALYGVTSELSGIRQEESLADSSLLKQELVLHAVEDVIGYNMYEFSIESADTCIEQAKMMFLAMDRKMVLDYTDKKHRDSYILQLSEGLSMKCEMEWHGKNPYKNLPWHVKNPLDIYANPEYVLGYNRYINIDRIG